MKHLLPIIELLDKGNIAESTEDVKVYDKSFAEKGNTRLLMIKDRRMKRILAVGEGDLFDELNGEPVGEKGKACPLTHENRLVLNKYFDYTVPKAFGTKTATIGLGDRLGLASPGHIEIIRDKKIKPILAQQSIRELTLTNRSMHDILDAASFAVFQEGYKGGFGADGDHLKREEDIELALSVGVTMVTLDCSDHINNQIERESEEEVKGQFDLLPTDVKDRYLKRYLNRSFEVAGGLTVTFDELALKKNVLLYGKAIDYMIHIFNKYIRHGKRQIDFEISIDETEAVTSPAAHFFVANELKENGVKVTSMAPRFCGEFQKGIDYIGDIDQLEKELKEHALISDYFGYKLSIHSGSDKFSVFPLIPNYTNGIFHIKTAGTNWLEAIRVIARVNPGLYRRMHKFALENFEKTLQYYHVTPNLDSIRPIDEVPDTELDEYMNDPAARQLFHVTYGLILTEKTEKGQSLFKEELFNTLIDYEEEYRKALVEHIGKHLTYLKY